MVSVSKPLVLFALDHCGSLELMKKDFRNVLQASVQKQWDEVQRAMTAFNYFDAIDEASRREACIIAKMKSFDKNETVLGDGTGIPNFVYFILSGRCQMIESMQVIANTQVGKTIYSLYDPYVSREESEQDFDQKYFKAYKHLTENSTAINSVNTLATEPQQPTEHGSITHESQRVLEPPSTLKQLTSGGTEDTNLEQNEGASIGSVSRDRSSPLKSQVLLDPRDSVRLSVTPEVPVNKTPTNLRTYFMQVCQFHPGFCFGFGENMRDRRIIALTPVDCMLLPMVWLMQRNTANIWTRIQHYLKKKIPTKKMLFREFVRERHWRDFRGQVVEEVVSRSNTVNWTTVHDVPYSIRMDEVLDM